MEDRGHPIELDSCRFQSGISGQSDQPPSKSINSDANLHLDPAGTVDGYADPDTLADPHHYAHANGYSRTDFGAAIGG